MKRRCARSYKLVERVLLEVADLKPAEKLVLAIYAKHAKDDGTGTFPSIPTVARYAGLSVDETRRLVHQLVKAGLMQPVGNTRGGNRFRGTQYVLTIQAMRQPLAITQGVSNTSPLASAQGVTTYLPLATSTVTPCKFPPLPLAPMQGKAVKNLSISRARTHGREFEARPGDARNDKPNPTAADAETSNPDWQENRRRIAALRRKVGI